MKNVCGSGPYLLPICWNLLEDLGILTALLLEFQVKCLSVTKDCIRSIRMIPSLPSLFLFMYLSTHSLPPICPSLLYPRVYGSFFLSRLS